MYAYSFSNIVVTVNGIIIDNFGAGDDVISIAPAEAAATTQWGADGHMVASISANRGGTCSLHLQQTSPGNYVLQQLYNAQIAQGATFQPISMSVKDALKQDSCTCTGGIITTQPTWQRGINAVDVVWEIQFENVVITQGIVNQLSAVAPLGTQALGGAALPGFGF